MTAHRQIPFGADDQFAANFGYAVRATVTVDGKLTWTTDTHYPVITNGETKVDVTLVQAGG